MALIVVGVVSAVLLLPHIPWQRESSAALAYVCLLFVGPIAAGSCFLVAGMLRSHSWELTGAIILVGSFVARIMLARWLRRRYPGDVPKRPDAA